MRVIYTGPLAAIQPVSTLILYQGVVTEIPASWTSDDTAALLRKFEGVTQVFDAEEVPPPAPPATVEGGDVVPSDGDVPADPVIEGDVSVSAPPKYREDVPTEVDPVRPSKRRRGR